MLDQLRGSIMEVKQCLACGHQKDGVITDLTSLVIQVPQTVMTIESAIQQTFKEEVMDDPKNLCRLVGVGLM